MKGGVAFDMVKCLIKFVSVKPFMSRCLQASYLLTPTYKVADVAPENPTL